MITRLGVATLLLALVAAAGLYVLKDHVRRLEGDLARANGAVRAEHAVLDRLQAEWAMLNQPGRLARLARSHLGLRPAHPGQIVAIDQIPLRSTLALRRLALRAPLPSGAEVQVRIKPLLLPAVIDAVGPVAAVGEPAAPPRLAPTARAREAIEDPGAMTDGLDPGVVIGRQRVRLLGVVMVLALLGLAGRLVDLAAWSGRTGLAPAAVASGLEVARRADIVDRNGILLATDYPKTSVFADPVAVLDRDDTAVRLAAVLGVEPTALLAKLSTRRRFVWLKRHITDAEHRATIRLGLPGIGFRTEFHRVYPQRALTAHLVGYVGLDNQGLAGIERSLETRLTGTEHLDDPLVLTLDLGIQELVRSELDTAVRRFAADGGTGLVLDAATGDILAMVSLPDFDPNRYQIAPAAARFNRNTQGTYEMGSLFKLFTAAMALDAGVIDMGSGYDATLPFAMGRHRIHDFHAKRRWLSVAEIIAHSSNIGVAHMADALGPDLQMAYLGRFGLLDPLPLDLEMATPQLPEPWRPINGITAAYGHGIAVSPLHVADALGGILCSGPIARLVAGEPPKIRPTSPVDPATAAKVRWLMWLTVAEGTGKLAKVPGYLVGGKTGSADKPGPEGYGSGRLLSSFVGAFPIDQPRYLVLVTLDEPKGDAETGGQAHGGWTAAPTAGRIISRIGPLLGLPPIAPDAERWFRDRLEEGQATNGRTRRVEPSLRAVPGSRWMDDQEESGCACRPCSILS